jgi:ketosteroid isomerase-like protein
MSQENVELVQSAYELFGVRDLPAFFGLFDPTLTYANRADEPDARVYQGVEDFKGYVASWLDAFDDLRFDFHEFVDLGDRVVVVTDLLGRGRATGADVRGAYVFLWTIREGTVVEVREYATKEEALEAAALSEQDVHADSS